MEKRGACKECIFWELFAFFENQKWALEVLRSFVCAKKSQRWPSEAPLQKVITEVCERRVLQDWEVEGMRTLRNRSHATKSDEINVKGKPSNDLRAIVIHSWKDWGTLLTFLANCILSETSWYSHRSVVFWTRILIEKRIENCNDRLLLYTIKSVSIIFFNISEICNKNWSIKNT